MPAAPDFPPAADRVTPKRALISLSDKAGLVELGHAQNPVDSRRKLILLRCVSSVVPRVATHCIAPRNNGR